MSSRTMRLPSLLTTRLATKLSIENWPRACAAAGAAVASTRASARIRPMRSAPERDARNLALFGAVELEVLPLGEAEEQRDLVGREAVDAGVEVADDRVVVAARALDRLFDLAERGLQLVEALVGLELRIRFRQREELAQGACQLIFGLGARLRGRGRHRGTARTHDLIERVALVRGVAPYGLDEVRHEIGTALELHVDVRPRFFRALAQPDELVIGEDDPEDQTHENDEKHDAAERHEIPPRSS